MVRGFQGRTAAGADAHRARAELRSARCGGARRAGARQSRHHALESVSAIQRGRRRRDHSPVARRPDAPSGIVRHRPESQLGRGVAQSAVVRSRHLGTPPPRHRSRARQSSERGGKSQSRRHHAGQRCRHRLFHPAAARLRARDFTAHPGHPPGIAAPGRKNARAAASPLCSICARPSSWSAARRRPSRPSAADRADRESDQSAAGQESRRCDSRPQVHRAGNAARSARRHAFVAAGAPS